MHFFKDVKHKKAPYSVRIVKLGCENYGRRWQSASGSLEDYQKCKNCYEKNYPSSYEIQAPNKRGNENRETFQAHNTELRGRCERLGFSCMESGNFINQDSVLVSDADAEEVVLTKLNDLSEFIVSRNEKKPTNIKVNKYTESARRIIEASSRRQDKNDAQRSVVALTSIPFHELRPKQDESNIDTTTICNDVANTAALRNKRTFFGSLKKYIMGAWGK